MPHAKSFIAAMAVVLTCVVATIRAEEESTTREASPSEKAVRKVVEQHIQGIVEADSKLLEAAWDTKAGRIEFVTTSEDGKRVVHAAPIGESLEMWARRKYPGNQGKIESVDVVNDQMALVKAQVTWKRQVFEDYLVLLYTDQGWKLVSKTYTTKGPTSGGYGVGLNAP